MQLLEGKSQELSNLVYASSASVKSFTHFQMILTDLLKVQFFDFLSSHRVLTAAHCLRCDDHGCPTTVDVYIGTVKSLESPSKVVKAKSWMMDETYSGSSQEHDLALSKSNF